MTESDLIRRVKERAPFRAVEYCTPRGRIAWDVVGLGFGGEFVLDETEARAIALALNRLAETEQERADRLVREAGEEFLAGMGEIVEDEDDN